jgi:hypothetical protein
MEYCSSIRKKDVMSFARKWTELEIMSSEISQIQKDKYYMFSLIFRIYIFKRHESKRGTIWEEEGDYWEGGQEKAMGVNMIKVH